MGLPTLRASLYGVRFCVHCEDDQLRARLLPGLLLDHDDHGGEDEVIAYSVSRQSVGDLWEVRKEDRVVFSSPQTEAVCATLLSELHHSIAVHSPFLFVHAGVVEWRSRAILLPGRSFAGKTTLVQSLVELGARYYSDEFAVIAPDSGRIHSFPRPPGIRDSIQRRQQKNWSSPGSASCQPGSTWFLNFREGGNWDVEPLSVGAGALELFQNTIAAERFGGTALGCFARILKEGCVWRGSRDSADLSASRILGWLESASGHVGAEFAQ